MGRNLWPAQSHCLRSTIAEPAITIIITTTSMQNYHRSSQAQTQVPPLPHSPPPPPPPRPLVCLGKDTPPAERCERRGRDRKLKIPVSGVSGHMTRDDDEGKVDSDLPEVFDSDPVSTILQQQQHCEEEYSVENIPSVPNIIIQYAVPATSNKTALHSDPPSVGLFAKKGRTHSDSVIYESELKKQCLLSSCLSGSRSLSCTPSGHLACERHSTCDATAEIGSSGLELPSDRDGCVTLGSFGQKPQFLKPISWTSCRLDQFRLAEQKSPKLYWLRRHSDSNFPNEEDKEALDAEGHCTSSPRSTGDEAGRETEREESVKCTTVRSEDPDEKVLHWRGGVQAEGRTPEERKCLKVKKYLQTRYQNQLVDTDDVFMDVAADSKPDQPVLRNLSTAEASRSLPRRELIDSSSGGGNAETMASSRSGSPKREQSFLVVSNAADLGYSRKFSSRANDDDVRRFQDDVVAPVTSLLPATRQTIFDFSFPAAYSSAVLRDIPDGSGANVIFGLLPQNCFSAATLVSSPLPVDGSGFSNSSPTVVPVSVVRGVEENAIPSPDPVSDSSKRRQFGLSGGAGECPRRRRSKKKPDHSSGNFVESVCHPDRPGCCPSAFGLRQSSNNSTDEAVCLGKNAEKDTAPLSSPSTIVISSLASSQMFACPSPSSSPAAAAAVVTPPTSKSCPQVVFDYQFSERINEQRQARDNGSFVCPVCTSVYPSYNSLANHVVSHLPSEVITPDGAAGDSSKVHLCKVCNRSFSRSDMLSRHMRLHTGLRPYECHLCQQVFSRSDHLHTHLRTHTGEKPYRCSHCLYAAPRRDMVTRHMRIHVRGGGKRGRRSSSTSSLASEAGQTSDDNGVFDSNNAPSHHHHHHPTPRRRPTGVPPGRTQQKQRNWSVTSADNNDAAIQDCCFEDKDVLLKMTRTESTTSIDSGVSYLTPRSLVPSLWSPGIDSPDVFSRYPGHFLWPSTSAEIKHDTDRGGAANVSGSRDATDFEMHTSFQKCQVVSPLEQRFSVNSSDLLGDQQREECV